MRKVMLWLAISTLAPLGVAPGRAADPSLIAGHWEATLPVLGSIRLVLNVNDVGGALKATFDSPDQGSMGLPVDSVTLESGTLIFTLKSIQGSFKGTVNVAANEAAGVWTQGGRETPLTFKKTDRPARLTIPEALIGIWEGPIKVKPGSELRLVFRVVKAPDGSMTVFFASPDQGAQFLPINAIALEGSTVKLESKPILAKYTGTLNAEKTAIDGTWTQASSSYPLTFKKVEKPTASKRSQIVKPPFPYKSEDVTYANPAAGLSLAGTLTIPTGKGPFPAALMITGSGGQDRDETLMGHKPFLVIADALTRRGIAVLRVDDRGVGKSTGSQEAATSADFAGDVEAGVAYLKSRPEVDPKAIGLIGHSEGGLIAPMVAARSADVGFIVLMAGTGVDGRTIVREQGQLILKAEGGTEDQMKAQAKLIDEAIAVVLGEADEKAATAKLDALAKAMSSTLTKSENEAMAQAVGASLQRFNSPWFRFFLTFDPKPTLGKVRCPVLAINGERDLQVPCASNLDAIASALKAGGNDAVTIKPFPGLNHLFQKSTTGAVSEYARIEETVNPEVLAYLGDWILKTTGRINP